jgi:3-oxoadipate enol-lactonase
MTPTIIATRADDGCELSYREWGGDDRRPIVFLVHALAMDASMWDGVVDALDRFAHVYAVDCRGHGKSGKPDGPYTTERFARDFANLLDDRFEKKVVIVGCSMGGTAALRFASMYPQRVEGIVAVDTTAWYGAEAPANWEARASKAEKEGMGSLIDFQLERWFSDEFKAAQPDRVKKTVDVFTANDTKAYAASCRMLGAADERESIKAWSGRSLVAVGEQDFATPVEMSKDLVSRIKGAELKVIPGAKHFTPIERPDAIAECIKSVVGSALRA